MLVNHVRFISFSPSNSDNTRAHWLSWSASSMLLAVRMELSLPTTYARQSDEVLVPLSATQPRSLAMLKIAAPGFASHPLRLYLKLVDLSCEINLNLSFVLSLPLPGVNSPNLRYKMIKSATLKYWICQLSFNFLLKLITALVCKMTIMLVNQQSFYCSWPFFIQCTSVAAGRRRKSIRTLNNSIYPRLIPKLVGQLHEMRLINTVSAWMWFDATLEKSWHQPLA